ncbi:MAG: electron transfer flavoprotein subunit alpha/FixB family protein [Bacteroidota bacterium]
MINKILVFVEQRNGQIKKSSLETVSTAKKVAQELNAACEAVIIGDTIENIDVIGEYGIQNVTHIKNPDLYNYTTSGYSKILSDHIVECGADTMFFANTAMGKDLSPFLAVSLDASITVDCTELNIVDGDIIATRPVYAGKALIDVQLSGNKKILTLRPNVFPAVSNSDTKADVTVKQVDGVNLDNKVVEIKKSSDKLDVAEADIIVSGGRGLKGPENFAMIEELAELLGAATGASRAAVDAGWRPHSDQVGQTGKTVSPNLYIAVGISGAIQHIAGMSSSKYIVAINKDKDAPIFQIADYGIADDAFEIVPALIEELKKT